MKIISKIDQNVLKRTIPRVFDHAQVAEWDKLIDDFNAATGALNNL